jgi:hypothetical protein
MPFALIVRMATRLALLAGVIFVRRRGRGAVPVPPSHRTPGTGPGRTPQLPEWLQALWLGGVPEALESVRLAGIALATVAFAAAALVLISAGTTLTVLGPRWVGIVLLAAAALFAAGAVRETAWLRRAVALRRRRRRVEEIAGPR